MAYFTYQQGLNINSVVMKNTEEKGKTRTLVY